MWELALPTGDIMGNTPHTSITNRNVRISPAHHGNFPKHKIENALKFFLLSTKTSAVKKYLLPALKQIMKDNKIKGVSLMNKPEILKLLIERGLLPAEAPATRQNPKYEHLKKKYSLPALTGIMKSQCFDKES